MKRFTLFALSSLCVLLVLGQVHAVANPIVSDGRVSFTFDVIGGVTDVTGGITAENLTTIDGGVVYNAYFDIIRKSDSSLIDKWEDEVEITSVPRPFIELSMPKKEYNLTPGETYEVFWSIDSLAATYDNQGKVFNSFLVGQMNTSGISWIDGWNVAYADVAFGDPPVLIDDFLQDPSAAFASATRDSDLYTDSLAQTDWVWTQSQLYLDPQLGGWVGLRLRALLHSPVHLRWGPSWRFPPPGP